VSQGIVETQQGSSSEGKEQQQGTSRTRLVQRLMAAGSNLPQFLHDLLMAQAVHVAGTEAACFMLEPSAKAGEVTLRLLQHIRPDNSPAEVRQQAVQAFTELVRPCIVQQKDGAIEIAPGAAPGEESQFCLVTLLRSEGNTIAVTAVVTRCLDNERAKQRLASMQLVAGYFDLFTLKRSSEQTKQIAESHQHVLQLATAAATSDGFEQAAKNLCNELATRTGAVRVSMGWMKGTQIKMVALSHTEKFDKKQELIIQLQRVMEECADQDSMVHYDPTAAEPSPAVTREAQMLSRSQGGNSVLSLPLRRKDEIVGVVTLEFLADKKLPDQQATGLAVAIDLVAPQLWDRHENDRWLITKAGLSVKHVAEETVGPKHTLPKVIALAVIVGLAVIFFYRPMYQVPAAFQFVPRVKLSVAAPYEGFIKQVYVLPGAQVKKGDKLADLDTYELELKRAGAMAEESRYRNEMVKAQGDGKPDEAGIAEEQYKQAHAELQLIEMNIAKAHLTAPLDGVVMSGDLKDKVGTPVKIGEQLFEVGQLSDLQAELSVDDRDIQDVRLGIERQGTGELATTAMPRAKAHLKVDHVVPLGEAKEGANVFKVVCNIEGDLDPTWLPGQAGEARIDVEKRTVAWRWTHRVVDFLRLKLWI
jgi:hypothetical protein